LITLLVAYQATIIEMTDNANTVASSRTTVSEVVKGTKKSTNPMGRAIKNKRLLW